MDGAEGNCRLTEPEQGVEEAEVSCRLAELGKGEEEEHGDDALEGEGVEKQGVTVLEEHGLPGEEAVAGDPL